jgi:hypothetical protein
MASQFFHVHHYVKPGMAAKWWEKAGEHLSDQSAVEKNVKAGLDLGFFNHSFMPVAQEGPMFCIWEAKEGISEADFQEFIDGPMGPDLGTGAINNNISQIDLKLTGGQVPYERKL